MKNFDYLTLEVLSTEELANVKGGNGPSAVAIERLASLSSNYGIPTPIIIED